MSGSECLMHSHQKKLEIKPFTGWPSGDSKPILELTFKINEMELRYTLNLIRERDDLDWYNASHFFIDAIGSVVVMQYDNSPVKGVVLYVDAEVNTQKAIHEITSTLELESDQIVWLSNA